MIVYQSTKRGFLDDAASGIEDVIRQSVLDRLRIDIKPGSSEYESWKNSLGNAMYHVMNTDLIPDDAGVAIEYGIPRTKNRIDFLITGEDSDGFEKVVIIELKQWSDVQVTDKDAVVTTHMGGAIQETLHPSYKAWTYSALLTGFNAVVYDEKIDLRPCAYLHNLINQDAILDLMYKDYLAKAPVFAKADRIKLQEFIASYVKRGEKKNTLYRIDQGKIRPSKDLANSLASMLKGNEEFIMIDEQKIVYETALALTKKSSESFKNVLIVEGGPGTGKSVVAINLLVAITKLGLNTQYVTKNAAPRGVFEALLTGSFKKSEISNFFSGSGSYINASQNVFDALIVDEAHRLNEKSGLYGNLGENQIKELISASKCAIFFLDEDQKVTWGDIGQMDEIEKWAKLLNAQVTKLRLESQFRCNGSDGYLAWLDDVLQIRDTANSSLEDINYDFRVIENPNELRDIIYEKNKLNNRARLVAGYCWNWVSRKMPALKDITIPAFNFALKWNLASDGNRWLIAKESVSEVGCIHTCQGLEMDYVGVIVGEDLVVRDGVVVTNPARRARTDASIKGYKKAFKEDPLSTAAKVDAIIKNTYRTLMTRGMKGCYVYFVDKETGKYFRDRMKAPERQIVAKELTKSPITIEMLRVPILGCAPCGNPFFGQENQEGDILVDKSKIRPGFKYFALRAVGDSMNRAGINDGDLLLCRQQQKAETGDRVVALLGGENVTIKEYGPRENGVRLLLPKSSNKKHQAITPEEGDRVQGVVQDVLE